jgi:hypothetical protein
VKLVILHQLPVELYPPVINWLRTISTHPGIAAAVVTSPNQRGLTTAVLPGVSFIRLPFANASQIAPLRWLLFLFWHLRAALQLYRWRPDAVLSVEPHSALAAWIWKVLLRGRAALLIHHHEYYSPADRHRPGNRLININRVFEKSLLTCAAWVSQTNTDRLTFFRRDHPKLTDDQCHVLPNYPPATWLNHLPKSTLWPRTAAGTLRLVYVGSVSLHDTYIGPLVEWIVSPSNTNCTLDIYSTPADPVTNAFLQRHHGSRVTVHAGGIDYDELPDVLSRFDVGLILYRCTTVNFVYNATNKLFEYLTCGLDVWYPPCMLGVAPYARSTAAPRVLETDFDNLQTLDLKPRQSRSHLPTIPWTTTCEDAFKPLLEMLKPASCDHQSKFASFVDLNP